MLSAFGEPGVIEKTGPSLGIAFSDQLLHGWDLAKATGQDATMPDGLAEAAYEMIHGRFTDEQRKGVFKPEVRSPPTRRRRTSCSPTPVGRRSIDGSRGARRSQLRAARSGAGGEGAPTSTRWRLVVLPAFHEFAVAAGSRCGRQLRQTVPWSAPSVMVDSSGPSWASTVRIGRRSRSAGFPETAPGNPYFMPN